MSRKPVKHELRYGVFQQLVPKLRLLLVPDLAAEAEMQEGAYVEHSVDMISGIGCIYKEIQAPRKLKKCKSGLFFQCPYAQHADIYPDLGMPDLEVISVEPGRIFFKLTSERRDS